MVNYCYNRRPIKIRVTLAAFLFNFGFILWTCIVGCNTDPKFQRIFLYHRSNGASVNYSTFYDYLVITNYEARPKTAAELYAIARHYADTVKATSEVNYVDFIARDAIAPRKNWDSEVVGEERHFFLIGFAFNHSNPEDIAKPKELDEIVIWKNAKPTIFYRKRVQGQMSTNSKQLDSILNSPIPLNNR